MKKSSYILEPYKGMNTRHRCPSCQHRDRTFSRYIDAETGEHLHPSVGRCNREINCGYHYTPKEYFQINKIGNRNFETSTRARARADKSLQRKLVSFIPFELFKSSLNLAAYESNHFVQYLIELFGVEVAGEQVSRYFIATSKHWNGATVFWQIDGQGRIRTGKIMLYSPTTGKRVKNLEPPVYWVHKALKQPEFELRQCLFGEHLLSETDKYEKPKTVAIVESEKTAVIASVYFPQLIWLACGSLTNLNAEKCSVLKGRTVVLFPDLNGFDKWSNKAKELSHIANFVVSDLLERKATEDERKQGLDLADYLIRFDRQEFATVKPDEHRETTPIHTKVEAESLEQIKPIRNFSTEEQPKPECWEREISDLEIYFTGISLPALPLKLNPSSTITDCVLFVESHLATVKANSGKPVFMPYLHRLQVLKSILTNQ